MRDSHIIPRFMKRSEDVCENCIARHSLFIACLCLQPLLLATACCSSLQTDEWSLMPSAARCCLLLPAYARY